LFEAFTQAEKLVTQSAEAHAKFLGNLDLRALQRYAVPHDVKVLRAGADTALRKKMANLILRFQDSFHGYMVIQELFRIHPGCFWPSRFPLEVIMLDVD
jgi:hypothetical protein